MIHSMTGFGASEKATDSYSLKVEIKTLNSKYHDPSLKIPKEFIQWEIEIKSLLAKGLKRGKINLSIEFIPKSFDEPPISINESLFESFYKKFSEMAFKVGSKNDDLFKLALYAPNVMVPTESIEGIISWNELKETIEEAIKKCNTYRADEGEKLRLALIDSKNKIQEGLGEVEKLDPSRVENVKKRLKQSIEEIQDKVTVDPNRFEQELIYYIEKLDISEEKVRLQSHLDYFDDIIKANEPTGKKLGFLSQEIGREINTIGSKANDAGMQRAVVGMKEELEKIKEQVLNVL